MTVTITREHADLDRYGYDCLLVPRGWAQLDTDQDAAYYGMWASLDALTLFAYCEGDCTTTECSTAEELAAEIRRAAAWHQRMDGWLRIDPCNGSKEQWAAAGLADLLF